MEHIGNYVFSNKNLDFSHQPIVYFAQKHFAHWKDTRLILRIAEILRQLRDIQHDNAQQLEYLLYRKPFPAKGLRWPLPDNLPMLDIARYPGAKALSLELSDSLASFYVRGRETCLIEHLVRLGEIRVARAMKDNAEEDRLRKMHVQEFGFVLIPLLEKQIEKYESDHLRYPDFNSFLPVLFEYLHSLKPVNVDALIL